MDLEEIWTVMRGMLTLIPGAGETARPRIVIAENVVRMHRGVRCDQMTGIVSRAGAVAGDMSADGTGTGNGAWRWCWNGRRRGCCCGRRLRILKGCRGLLPLPCRLSSVALPRVGALTARSSGPGRCRYAIFAADLDAREIRWIDAPQLPWSAAPRGRAGHDCTAPARSASYDQRRSGRWRSCRSR